jgi:hypothetical protein
MIEGASTALKSLLTSARGEFPEDFLQYVEGVIFTSSNPNDAVLHFPCPLKEQDATAAIKALEACGAAAIADLRFGKEQRMISVDIDKTACFLMSAYLTTVDGLGKGDKEVKSRIPGL